MKNKAIYDIKNKNSQEILLYLQRKNFKKNGSYFHSDYRKKLPTKISEEQNYDNFPKTRMNQFLNKTFYALDGNNLGNNLLSKSISRKTDEKSLLISTPQFTSDNSKVQIQKNNNNSQFSFSNANNEDKTNNSDSLNYLDFNLHENIDNSNRKSEMDIDDLCHIYLPKKYKDDEDYKSRLYKYLKYETENNYSHPFKGIKTKILSPKNNLYKIKKRKKLFSVKTKVTNKIVFFKGKKEKRFNLFKDDMIGFDKNWQLSGFYKNYDNDVQSDDDQVDRGRDKMIYDLKIGIVRWSQNKKNCYNFRYLDYPVEVEKAKRFSVSV